jgi:hypothetical protein
MLAIVAGPSGGDKPAAEQALLDRALTEYPWVFTRRRLFVMDRGFPCVPRIRRIIEVTHVLIRLVRAVARHHHPQGARPHHRLRHSRRLTLPPSGDPLNRSAAGRRTRPSPRNDVRATPMPADTITVRNLPRRHATNPKPLV